MKPPSSASVSDLSAASDALTPLVPILSAFAHRHHNQHKASHWWAAFNTFRRSVRSLLAILPPASRRPDAVKVQAQAAWMAQHVMPRAYVAFTQLVADNQHAPLGLMLLAVLARVYTVLSDLVPTDTSPATVSAAHPNQDTIPHAGDEVSLQRSPSVRSLNTDMGVSISRDSLASISRPSPVTGSTPPKSSRSALPADRPKAEGSTRDQSKEPAKSRKKKRKGGDALSSLFGSL